ncbi:MAG: hypothetical protein HY738_20795, partial [Bacteroidia bacterium]|nr:hypothetical protein [Bacteroidia bacterium]
MKKIFTFFTVTMIITSNFAQTYYKSHIGLSVTIDQEVLDDYPGGPIVFNQFEGKFEQDILAPLNSFFDTSKIEFYVYHIYFDTAGTNYYYGGPLNTIRVKYGVAGAAISSMGLYPGASMHFCQYLIPEDMLHEMGHMFGQWHIFDDYNGSELVVRPGEEDPGDFPANCEYAGDLIDDTPAINWITGAVDANGDYYKNTVGNFMDYYAQSMTFGFFTPGQYE